MSTKKPKKRLSAVDEMAIADYQFDRYVRARDSGHLDYIDMALKCDDFYKGNQWDPEDVYNLESQGRPALTINTILPTINTVLGEQSSRRQDVKFKPRTRADDQVAEVLTKVFMQITDNNKLEWIEQQVFADGLIMDGRGYFDVRMDFSDNIQGEIRITAKDPLEILLDPDAKDYDPKTWNEVFETKWMTLDEIEELYGRAKASKLQQLAENGQCYNEDSVEYDIPQQTFGDTTPWGDPITGRAPADDDYRRVRCLRVIERQYRVLHRSDYFVDEIHGDQRPVPETWTDKKARAFAREYGLGIISKVSRRVRWTVTCDKVVLHDDWSPYESFTIIPFFAYFRRGQPFGMVRNLISPQEQLNKIQSQELHIVNSTANSGWLVESGSLVGMTPDDLELHGAETGLVVEYAKGFNPPEKIQPNNIPQGLDRVSAKAERNIKTISGINDSMMGSDRPEVSGIAIQAKQNRGALMIQVPLDNLRKSRQYLAEKILNLIQRFYTEQRLIQVTDTTDPMEPREAVLINQMTPEGQVINDLSVGEYDVIIGTMPARDSYDEIQFAEALNLRQAGVMVPDDAVIEYSHLARKAELAKRIRQMTGQEPPTPEQAQFQQWQQQMAMKQLELSIMKLESEVQKLGSEATLNMAKAQDVSQVQPQLELQKLQTELQRRREELDLRRELADLSNEQRSTSMDTQAATSIAKTAMTTAAQRDAAKRKQASDLFKAQQQAAQQKAQQEQQRKQQQQKQAKTNTTSREK